MCNGKERDELISIIRRRNRGQDRGRVVRHVADATARFRRSFSINYAVAMCIYIRMRAQDWMAVTERPSDSRGEGKKLRAFLL